MVKPRLDKLEGLATRAVNRGNTIPALLSIGLLLFIAHYEGQPLLEYVFLPQIGAVILLSTVLVLVGYKWEAWKKVGLGPRIVWVPLAVIAGSAVLRLAVQPDLHTLAGSMFMVCMFALYVVSRVYGEKALSFFMPVVVMGGISVIVQAIIAPHSVGNSGIFNNYATASQFLVFGWLVSPHRHQWWLSALVGTALFATGAPEAILYGIVIGAYILIRRDWSRKTLLPIGVLTGLIVISTSLGVAQALWDRAFTMADAGYRAVTDASISPEERSDLLDVALNGRWSYGWSVQRPIQPLGYGLEITYHSVLTPHNIILLVTDQLGPLGACAWVVAVGGGMKKTKWKYAFLALLLFGVFQPFVWTMMAPYMWTMAGAATTSLRGSYVFRGMC